MSRPVAHTCCHLCGAAYPDLSAFPRICASCGGMVWDNPIPVALTCLGVRIEGREGLLVIRRGVPPHVGRLALVGGFSEAHETWQESAAREAHEEAGVVIDPATVTLLWLVSSSPRRNRLLMFATAPSIDVGELSPFTPDTETQERGLVFGPDGLDTLLAFPLHAEAARRWFAARGMSGAAEYRAV